MVNPERVRLYRQNRNLTISILAREVGVSRVHISHIESGRRQPSDEVLEKLAECLGTAVDDLCIQREANQHCDTKPETANIVSEHVDVHQGHEPSQTLYTLAMVVGMVKGLLIDVRHKVLWNDASPISGSYSLQLTTKNGPSEPFEQLVTCTATLEMVFLSFSSKLEQHLHDKLLVTCEEMNVCPDVIVTRDDGRNLFQLGWFTPYASLASQYNICSIFKQEGKQVHVISQEPFDLMTVLGGSRVALQINLLKIQTTPTNQ